MPCLLMFSPVSQLLEHACSLSVPLCNQETMTVIALSGIRNIILQNSNHYKHYPLATGIKVQKSHHVLVSQQLRKVNKMEV